MWVISWYMCVFGVLLGMHIASYPACLPCGVGSVCQCVQVCLTLWSHYVVFHCVGLAYFPLMGVRRVSDCGLIGTTLPSTSLNLNMPPWCPRVSVVPG